MAGLQSIDTALFRFVNQTLANPVFDVLMPFLSGNAFFFPALLVLGIWIIKRWGGRGALCIAFALIAAGLGDPLVSNTCKHLFARPRPFLEITDAIVRVGRGGSYSFPSSHAFNWFAASMVASLFFRRSWLYLYSVACAVAFSRVYNGVHYPSDVAGGAILGTAFAWCLVQGADWLWRKFAPGWFPLWFAQLPSLVRPARSQTEERAAAFQERVNRHPEEVDRQWLFLGYGLIAVLLIVRLIYLASGRIELSEDEAYQWHWSRHLALSYYSKPPFIAYAQFIGTSIWGNNAFGVRFLSPVITAILSWLMLRFFAREATARAGVVLLVLLTVVPLPAAGSILMTIDPLSVLFWTAAMLSGWRAIQEDSTKHWCWTGLWLGCGFLSKYTALFQLASWALFFLIWPPARRQIKRPGPWLALGIMLLCTLPVLIWNQQHGWITVTHLESRAGLEQKWGPTSRFLIDFTLAELALLTPVFLIGLLWTMVAWWRQERNNPLLGYLFSMGAPVFLGYWLYTLRARVQPNWIAPAVVPLFAMMVVYWYGRWKDGARWPVRWLAIGVGLGLPIVVFLHDTNLVQKITGRPLPKGRDPLMRVRGWTETADVVERERQRWEKSEGRPTFIIGAHYGVTSEISFYTPAAQKAVLNQPFVYYLASDRPQNQYYFWPSYLSRTGDNALYVQEVDSSSKMDPLPKRLSEDFESVEDVGTFPIEYRGRPARMLRLALCRHLRAHETSVTAR